ncbi:MAG: hypothetical protein V3U75_03895 [Methylococcaceae bacterium]
MKLIKLPGPGRMVWGAVGAYWLSHMIHPLFVFIAVIILLIIPILVVDDRFSQKP